MRFRSLCTAIALSALLLGSGCCCCRPFHCLRPFRCRLHEKFGCASCCPTVVEGSVSHSPVVVGPGAPCDCGGGDVAPPPTILRPMPPPAGAITPMPPASSATPLPGPGPLTRSN
jgi:hypothetical protein